MVDLVERLRIGEPGPKHPDWEVVWVQNLRAHFTEGMFSRRLFPGWNDIFLANVNSLLSAAPEAATLIETQAARISLLERGIEQAFRDGISYATNVDVKDVELAWNTSRARALNGGE